ncbi:ATP-binding protein [Candidatus Saccharibacteria bacterium]|nr:ATP-binding protein [Candidatus Saccharibacteria bacterium]
MKPLPVSTPTMFIMVGIPGAGKSHFAGQFARQYGLPVVTVEPIAEALPDAAPLIYHDVPTHAKIANHFAAQLAKTGKSFIIDTAHGNSKIERMQLQRLANHHRYQTLLVWVQVDEPSARQRVKRARQEQGKPTDEHRFIDAVKTFNAPTGERYVVVSGKHTFPAQHNAVVRKLMPNRPAPVAAAVAKSATVAAPPPAKAAPAAEPSKFSAAKKSATPIIAVPAPGLATSFKINDPHDSAKPAAPATKPSAPKPAAEPQPGLSRRMHRPVSRPVPTRRINIG